MMNRTRAGRSVGVGLATLVWLVAVAGCASTVALQSDKTIEPVRVDGTTAEWAGRLVRLEDGRASVGVQHDDETVYVAFLSRDVATVRSMVRSGFTLWFDVAGGKKKGLGVRFPLGRQQAAGDRSARTNVQQGLPEMGRTEGGPLDVIRADGFPERFAPDQARGIRVRATMDPSSIVYELSIARTWLSADGALPEFLGVGFEVPDPESPPTGPDVAGAAAGTSSRGRRSGGGGRGVGDLGPDGRPQAVSQSMKLWTKVRIAR